VFATAWANFVVELLTSHLLAAAIGEGQDFVDFVHFLFPFLSFGYTELYAPTSKKSSGRSRFVS